MLNNNKEKIIGLIVGDISDDFSKEIIDGVVNAIPNYSNIRLIILPGKFLNRGCQNEDIFRHNMVYNTVYDLGHVCHMDGLIIAMGSIGWMTDKSQIKEFLDSFGDIPKVLIACRDDDYTTVNYDNETGIREAIRCLINVHSMNCFCMLGGYDENVDAMARKKVFVDTLTENEIEFHERNYVSSDMSTNSDEAAEKLLNDNPDVQAIFCVNDSTAMGLYRVMNKRNLIPGRDIQVFAFDNTHAAGGMIPPLTSIGPYGTTLGHKALDILLMKMNGHEVTSEVIPTRLFGRESFEYEVNDFTLMDLMKMKPATINRMFDDCFYRYKNERVNRERVDLKRLFYEIVSRLFASLKRRYLGEEEFEDLLRMVTVFFENGAMEYTDVNRFLLSVKRMQHGLNSLKRIGTVREYHNRLFLKMKDEAIKSLADKQILEYNRTQHKVLMMKELLIKSMDYDRDIKNSIMSVMSSLGQMDINNMAFYAFDTSVQYTNDRPVDFPDELRMVALIKNGECFVIQKERQMRQIRNIFRQNDFHSECNSFAVLPVFYARNIFGFMVCELTRDIYDDGEFMAGQLGAILELLRDKIVINKVEWKEL